MVASTLTPDFMGAFEEAIREVFKAVSTGLRRVDPRRDAGGEVGREARISTQARRPPPPRPQRMARSSRLPTIRSQRQKRERMVGSLEDKQWRSSGGGAAEDGGDGVSKNSPARGSCFK